MTEKRRIFSIGIAFILCLWMCAVPVRAMEVYPLTEAEEALLVRCTAQFAAEKPLVCQVCVAAALLTRLTDARYPDTVSGVAADAGMVALPVREAAWEEAVCAVRLARLGVAPSRNAVVWAEAGSAAATRMEVVFSAGEMVFGVPPAGRFG